MEATSKKGRQPRAAGNPMAAIAHRVLERASDGFKTANDLAAAMEPHLNKLYGNGNIYSYTAGRVVPPGDVLLAAAVAAGISLDRELGIEWQPTEQERRMAELQAEMGHLREVVADLQNRVGGQERVDGPQDQAAEKERRRAERKAWARSAPASPPPAPSPTAGRQSGRARGV